MPRYVRDVTAYALNRPSERWARPPGPVFEQEFTDERGLMGPYLMHPIHWARVDRWFDPECPEFIVRQRICQLLPYRVAGAGLMGGTHTMIDVVKESPPKFLCGRAIRPGWPNAPDRLARHVRQTT